jgi:hypothetical protein
MKDAGFAISEATYKREKRKINDLKLQRLHHIAQIGFEDQHLARIDNCEMIERLMWQDYLLEPSPYKRVMILKEIKELQPYISSYYDATRGVMQLTSRYQQYSVGALPPPPVAAVARHDSQTNQ